MIEMKHTSIQQKSTTKLSVCTDERDCTRASNAHLKNRSENFMGELEKAKYC